MKSLISTESLEEDELRLITQRIFEFIDKDKLGFITVAQINDFMEVTDFKSVDPLFTS